MIKNDQGFSLFLGSRRYNRPLATKFQSPPLAKAVPGKTDLLTLQKGLSPSGEVPTMQTVVPSENLVPWVEPVKPNSLFGLMKTRQKPLGTTRQPKGGSSSAKGIRSLPGTAGVCHLRISGQGKKALIFRDIGCCSLPGRANCRVLRPCFSTRLPRCRSGSLQASAGPVFLCRRGANSLYRSTARFCYKMVRGFRLCPGSGTIQCRRLSWCFGAKGRSAPAWESVCCPAPKPGSAGPGSGGTG